MAPEAHIKSAKVKNIVHMKNTAHKNNALEEHCMRYTLKIHNTYINANLVHKDDTNVCLNR